MLRSLPILSALLLAVPSARAAAEDSPIQSPNPLKVRVHLGYGISGEFRNRNNDLIRLEGPVVGLELPLSSMAQTDIALNASFFGGGRIRSGNDSDADVYRFVVTARRPLTSSMYGKVGLGFAHSSPRSRQNFGGASGSVAVFGLGGPIGGGFLRRFTPNFEVNVFASPSAQLRGIFFGITGGL